MAEQRVWNKKLLVVSFITAVVAVGLFYVYDSIQQRKITGDVVEVLKWRRDLRAGEEINPADIAVVKITRQAVQALEGVMRKEDMKGMVTDGAHVNRDVRRQGFVLFQDIIEIQGDRPSRGISTGKCAFTLRWTRRMCRGVCSAWATGSTCWARSLCPTRSPRPTRW